MEGSPSDTTAPPEKKGDKKPEKKAETAFGLGKSTFEFTNRKDKAEMIAEAPLWKTLLPNEGAEKPKSEKGSGSVEKSEKSDENSTVEAAHFESPENDSSEEVADAELENVSPVERPAVVSHLAQQESAQRKAELESETDPAEREGLEQEIEHLDKIAAAGEIIPADTESAEDITETTDAASEQLDDAQAEEAAEETTVESQVEEVAESAELPEDMPAEFEHGQEIPLNQPEQVIDVEDAEEEDVTPQTATPPPPQPAAPPTPTQNPNRAANQPPTPPVVPPATPSVPGGPNTTNNNFNFYNFPSANPNAAPVTIENNYYDNLGGALLAGGILGYMLGRRRGRIKTEKRLKAVSKKLERQIEGIRSDVVQQGALVRQQAKERYNLTHSASHESAPMQRGAETTAARTVNPSKQGETITKITTAEVQVNQKQAAERLGITTEEAAATAERIQRFDHREVLAIAEKVSIDGTSLRTIYESKQITEPGLRRITREFLRGGDVKAALQAEIKVKEMQYERDPQMRDRLAASYADVDAAQPQAAKEAMASLLAQEQPRPTMYQHKEADVQKEEKDDKSATDMGKKALISAWAVLVVILVITAIVLASR